MARPLSAAPPASDLGYRPQSHFRPIGHDTHVIAAVETEQRRKALRAADDADRVTPLDARYATPTLSEADRRALGRLHPSLMGGEYLPDRRDRPGSSTGSSTSTAATRSRRSAPGIEMPPLSLGERNTIFLGAWPLNEVPEGNELDRDGAQDFTRPPSGVYPRFKARIRAGIDGWRAEGDDEEDRDRRRMRRLGGYPT